MYDIMSWTTCMLSKLVRLAAWSLRVVLLTEFEESEEKTDPFLTRLCEAANILVGVVAKDESSAPNWLSCPNRSGRTGR